MSRLSSMLTIATLLLTLPGLAFGEKANRTHLRPGMKKVQLRRMSPHAKNLSFRTPPVQRTKVKINTWGTNTTVRINHPKPPAPRINRDPWQIQATGYNHGARGTVKKQIRSENVVLPKIRRVKITNKNRKAQRKQWSRAMRSAVRNASQWRLIGNFKVNTNAPAETYSKVEKDVLPAHTPVKVEAKTIFNQRYGKVVTNAAGLPARREKVENVTVRRGGQKLTGQKITTASGEYLPAFNMQRNVNTKNVFVSTAMNKTKTTMTVDKLRQEHGLQDGNNAFRFNPALVNQYRNLKKNAANNVRAQTTPLHQQNTTLRAQIAELKAAKPRLSKATRQQIADWKLQIKGNNTKVAQLVNNELQRAYSNQPVVQQFTAYNKALKTLRKNSTLGQQKTTSSTLRLLGLAAFPAGSNVKVTNLRTSASVSRKANQSGSRALEIKGMQADRLRVDVSFPNAQTAQGANYSFVVQAPKASGSRSIKRRGVTYYQANVE